MLKPSALWNVSFSFIYLFIHLHAHTLFSFHCFYIFSCIPAFPPVNASARNASCIFYEYKGEFCKNITRSLYVYGDQSTLDFGEREVVNFDGYLNGAGIASSQLKTCSVAMFSLSVMNHWLSLKNAVFVAAHANICKSSAKGKWP